MISFAVYQSPPPPAVLRAKAPAWEGDKENMDPTTFRRTPTGQRGPMRTVLKDITSPDARAAEKRRSTKTRTGSTGVAMAAVAATVAATEAATGVGVAGWRGLIVQTKCN